MSTTAPVSVVVPTAGRRHELLLSCLRSIADQEHPHEIFVVAPPGRELPREVNSIACVLEQKGSIAAAINTGIRRSQNEVVAVTHDDCVVSRSWLREISDPLRGSPAIACVGQTVPSREGRAYPATLVLPYTERRFVKLSKFEPFWDVGLIGNNFALRRDVIGRVGPFNESLGVGSRLRGGEDLDMFHRILAAGLTVCVNPQALALHEPLDTWQEEMRMMYSYRVGLAAYFFCHRKEAAVRDYFLRRIVVDQLRRIWRTLRQTRTERLGMEAIAMLGLQVGAAKAWLYRL